MSSTNPSLIRHSPLCLGPKSPVPGHLSPMHRCSHQLRNSASPHVDALYTPLGLWHPCQAGPLPFAVNVLLAPPVLWLSILGHHFPAPAESLLTQLGLLPFMLGCPSIGATALPSSLSDSRDMPPPKWMSSSPSTDSDTLTLGHCSVLLPSPPTCPWIVQQGKEREGEEAVIRFLFFLINEETEA